ncbi:sensor histidine kinase [Actinophytocola oryzae]|uniref:histidine kinase n=1 Tax=Actinophytocola oryzae TaxID=502181 RepID=A0A4R7W0I5_9PSEU|nr:histidine kinase [Actinophytocola oryzae]TDV56020.1 histidine kinase [Actinophytocola oryzae]
MFDLRLVVVRWRRFDVTVRDAPFAPLLAALSLTPSLDSYGTQLGGLSNRPMDALAVALVAVECLSLAVRRRWPAACLLLVSAGFAADQLLGYHTVAGSALPVALLSAGSYLERHRRVAVVASSAGYGLLVAALEDRGATESVLGFVTFYLGMALAWGFGVWLRRFRAAEAVRRRQVAEATRVAERGRIARELHDVVTHHVTAMVVQAEAARCATASPELLDRTLVAITDTGRRAITDLRHLLDLLNPDHGTRAPAAGDLRALVERTRLAGQPVRLTEEGDPAGVDGDAGEAAYRVVQEALTNALKHAHGNNTAVRVHRGPSEITIEVDTDGPGSHATSPRGSGRGLAGLRDRVGVLGGELTSGPVADGGFAVRARIPRGGPS